jgi:hypothetical protein
MELLLPSISADFKHIVPTIVWWGFLILGVAGQLPTLLTGWSGLARNYFTLRFLITLKAVTTRITSITIRHWNPKFPKIYIQAMEGSSVGGGDDGAPPIPLFSYCCFPLWLTSRSPKRLLLAQVISNRSELLASWTLSIVRYSRN